MFGLKPSHPRQRVSRKLEKKGALLRELPAGNPSSKRALTFSESEIETSLTRRFEFVVSEVGRRTAVTEMNRRVSYRELDAWSSGLTRRLLRSVAGVNPAVAILGTNQIETVVAVLATIKTGGYFVPLSPYHPDALNRSMLEQSDATVLVTTKDHMAKARKLAGRRVKIVPVEESGGFSSAFARPRRPDSPACLSFTSSSSGTPKGVMQTDRTILHDAWRQSLELKVTRADRFGWLFPFISSASLRDLFGALMCGARLSGVDARSAGFTDLACWVKRTRVSVLHVAPSLFRYLAPLLSEHDRGASLRVVSLGSETATRRDFMLFAQNLSRSCVLQNVYGSTETRVVSQCFLTHDSNFDGDRLPIGWAVRGKEIEVWREDNEPAAPGEAGQIVVRSGLLPEGYWRRPDLSEGRFLESPERKGERLYLTGDVGSVGEGGELRFRGRRDLEVKIRGQKVDLSAVESCLASHPDVTAAAASVSRDRHQDDHLTVYLCLKAGRLPSVSQFRRHVQESLPAAMVPHRFRFLEALPRLPGGKLDRRALPEVLSTPAPREAPPRALTANEKTIATIWASVLGTCEPGPEDDFFDLGGDSLLAAATLREMEDQLGVSLSLRILHECRTIESLAARIAAPRRQRPEIRLSYLNPGGKRSPLILFPGRAESAVSLYRLCELLGPDRPVVVPEYRGIDGFDPPDTTIEAMATAAIEALRESGQTGPYRLGGHSLGGLVAYEAGRKLEAAGEAVEFILLIDTSPPPALVDGFAEGAGSGVEKKQRSQAGRGDTEYWLPARRLNKHDWRFIEDRLQQGEVVPLVLRHDAMIDCAAEAVRNYSPQPTRTPLFYFHAVSEFSPSKAETLDAGWRSLALGGLEIQDVVGTHLLLRDPHVVSLASALHKLLERFEAKDSAGEAFGDRPELDPTHGGGDVPGSEISPSAR